MLYHSHVLSLVTRGATMSNLLSFPFLQMLFAMSPLLALAYVLFSAFEDPKAEALKRRKKGDFELEGHGD
jgi:hypothetical protein